MHCKDCSRMWRQCACVLMPPPKVGASDPHGVPTGWVPRGRCSADPRAPHGYNRNASVNEDRYVCDCECWDPPPAEAAA